MNIEYRQLNTGRRATLQAADDDQYIVNRYDKSDELFDSQMFSSMPKATSWLHHLFFEQVQS